DGDISWQWFDEKYNADLANGLGNLVARSVTLMEKMQKSPPKADAPRAQKIKNQNDPGRAPRSGAGNAKCKIKSSLVKYKNEFENLGIDKAINIINGEIKFLDNYITENKPWEMIKNNDEKIGKIMYNILERLRIVAWMVWPFMPAAAEKIWSQLGLAPAEEMKKDFNEAIKWGGLAADTKVEKSEILFPRI
ncbi:MAG: class I tRNA ligase family protein, partial [bacterium]|nr:class I tRNA ligase family protein [bacterium]